MIESNDNQLRVAVYLRVSTDDQVEKFGIPMQKESIMALIKSKGRFSDGREKMVLAGEQYIYIDEGISGTRPIDERPAFSRLKEDLLNAPKDRMPFDVVAVYKIDRFARKLSILVKIIEFFEEYKIKMLSANESIDTSTAFGRAVLGIIGVIAELEIETFKQRSSDGRQQAIKRGVFMGESLPFGFSKNPDKTPYIQPEEAIVVRDIFRMFNKELKSAQQIANALQEMQVPSPSESALLYKKKRGLSKKKNKQTFWRDTQVKKILSDEIYIGNYLYGKSVKGVRQPKEQWKRSDYIFPSIIEKADFAIAQRRLNHSRSVSISNRRSIEGDHIYLLSGLLRCDQCLEQNRSDTMPYWIGERKRYDEDSYAYYYKCGRRKIRQFSEVCNVSTLPANQIEEIVLSQVKELLENPEPVINYQNKLKSQTLALDDLKTKRQHYVELINSIPNKIERLKEQHEAGIISTLTELQQKISDQEVGKKKLLTQLEDVDLKINQTVLSKNYLETFEFFKEKYAMALENIEQNRQFIHEMLVTLLEHVVVKARLANQEDVVSGRKKDDQYLPHKLDLYFRLPKDMLQEAFLKFGVKNANL